MCTKLLCTVSTCILVSMFVLTSQIMQLCTSVCSQLQSNRLHFTRHHSRDRRGSETKYWSFYAQHFLPMMTATQVGSTQRRRTKKLKWIYSSPVWGWMCRRWSDDHLCSLLKWNMMVREPSAISCLAQEEPIWSWVLSVLCCCVARRCNGSCHCCSCSQCCYFWSTAQVSWGRWGAVEEIIFIA